MSATPADEVAEAIRIGRAQRKRGEIDGAIDTFTAAHRRFPGDPRPLVQRGAVLILNGCYDDALSDYEAAQRRDPEYPGLRSYFAEAYLYLGRPAQALTISDEGIRAEPGDLMHRINRAHSLLFLDRIDDALAEYAAVAARQHTVKGLTGAQIVLSDFQLLQEAGITAVGMPDVQARSMAALRTPLTLWFTSG
jgi:tetratricopeptide (TPR) repeat protein